MEALDQREGLYWLIRFRFVVITFILGIQLAVVRFTGSSTTPVKWFVAVIVVWYIFTIFFSILLRIWPDLTAQSYVQFPSDALMVPAIVHPTGGVECHFIFLYALVVIVAGISLTRPGTYLVASLSFIMLGTVLALAYNDKITVFWQAKPDLRVMLVNIFTNLFAFIVVAYLSTTLVESLRKTGTKLTQTSGELETLQAFNQNVLDSIGAGVITTDLDGRIQLLNRAGEGILGRSLASLFARRLSDALPELAAIRGAPDQEVRLTTPTGKDRVLEVTVSPLTATDGSSLGKVYFMQDLTEVKRLEGELRLQDRMAALGRMAAAIAHEIRNPLTSIAGSVQVFTSFGDLSEDERRLVEIVRKESERLDRILADFLSYSRERKYQFEPANLVALAEETLTLMRHRPEAERWKLESAMPAEPLMAQVDVDAIKQVFWNLCDNALKAMPDGGTLRLEARIEGEYGVIRFVDTGCGLSPRQLEKFFEPFQSNFRSGAGLGLAIVYEIVSAHQGTITARAAPEGGSVFCLSLPLVLQPVVL